MRLDDIKNKPPRHPSPGRARLPTRSEKHDSERRARHEALGLEKYVAKFIGQPVTPVPDQVNIMHSDRAWIIDTGASIDVINKESLQCHELDLVRQASTSKVITGATGKGSTDEQVRLPVLNQRTKADAWIMPECPPTLSLGRRCMLDGYSFHWEAKKPPTLVEPNGRVHILEIFNYVPFFNENKLSGNHVGSVVETPQTEHQETTAPAVPESAAADSVQIPDSQQDPQPPAPTRSRSRSRTRSRSPTCQPVDLTPTLTSNVPAPAHFLTHHPKHPACPVCQCCKMQRARCARKHDAHSDDPQMFGDGVTADHIIIPADWESYQKDRAVCVILDRGTGWIGAYPCKTKNAEDTKSCFQHFLGSVIPKKVYTDGSHEFKNALKSLGLPHDVATPHRPQTNGIAERAVKRILEGARCLLKQSGLPEYFWPDAVRCFSFPVQRYRSST